MITQKLQPENTILKLNYNSKTTPRKHNTEAELQLKKNHQKAEYTTLKLNYNSKTTTRIHNTEAIL